MHRSSLPGSYPALTASFRPSLYHSGKNRIHQVDADVYFYRFICRQFACIQIDDVRQRFVHIHRSAICLADGIAHLQLQTAVIRCSAVRTEQSQQTYVRRSPISRVGISGLRFRPCQRDGKFRPCVGSGRHAFRRYTPFILPFSTFASSIPVTWK